MVRQVYVFSIYFDIYVKCFYDFFLLCFIYFIIVINVFESLYFIFRKLINFDYVDV